MTEDALFKLAVSTPDAKRAALLDRECAGNPALRDRIDARLAAERTKTFGAEQSASTVVQTSQADVAGTTLAGKYKLIEAVGEGGMGRVWLAHQSEPVKRRVAVKLIKRGMDSQQVLTRFEAERQAPAMMDHPNIAKVFDGGLTPDGRPFFVMELVKGVPITEYCDQRKLSPRRRLELFVPVCLAIQHAHQKGIIHRDIKPSNVLVALYDDKAVPKVIDFGVAKATGQPLSDHTINTGLGAVIGTPEYMSPEQATLNNLDIDTRSDVYSLGVLLYELLTGSTPLDRQSLGKAALLEILRIVREVEAPKLSTIETSPSVAANRGTEPAKLAKMMRGELDWVVLKALEKDRTRRYDTANGLARDIQRYLADEIVEARPPSTRYRLRKFIRRHKGQVIAASLVFFVLAAGMIGTTFGLVRADEQRQIAEENERVAVKAVEAERQAKRREATQLAIAVEQRANAEQARDRTREVQDAMVSEVTGDSLATQKVISEEQKKFLHGVLGYYREFAGENAADERSRQRHARAAGRVGLIEYRLGRKVESERAYRIATEEYASLVVDFPAVPEYRLDLAASHNSLGLLLAGLGKRPEAEEQYHTALAIQVKLAADFPDIPTYRQELARSHNDLGAVLVDLDKRPEAEKQYRLALAIREKLAADFPTLPAYRQDLAASHNNQGNLLVGLGKRPEAGEQYRNALAIREKLAADFPALPAYRRDLARTRGSLGQLLAELGKRPEAGEQYRRALAIQEKLAADFPAVPEYRSAISETSYNVACVCAITSSTLADKKQEYADRAMEMLQKAVNAGYKDATLMAKNTDLDPLRDRDDFKKLLAELAKENPAGSLKQP